MALQRLYLNQPLSKGQQANLTAQQAHYLRNVLRYQEGQELLVFHDGCGEYRARIEQLGKKSGLIRLDEQTRTSEPLPELWLAFAPIKAGRIDFLVEKATELGATKLMPVRTDRTIVSRINEDRLRANMIEAAEQSERLEIPQLAPYQPIETLLDQWDSAIPLLYGDESGGGAQPNILLPTLSPPIAVLIGPEGGFSEREHAQLKDLSFCHALSLGRRILRADTAALASLTLMHLYYGEDLS